MEHSHQGNNQQFSKQGVEERHECRQDKAKLGEKAEFMCDE
jgi:hypothetical protein